MTRRLVAAVAIVALTACAGHPPGGGNPGVVAGRPSPSAGSGASPPAAPPPPTESESRAAPRPQYALPIRIERRTSDAATAGFAAEVLRVLRDRRGWRRAGFLFSRDPNANAVIVLDEGAEVDQLCEPYDTGGKFSCQNGPVVALNADRWRRATPSWPGSLSDYRTMLINHEVGHLLHMHHPDPQCPGDGLPAPVMTQQSTTLDGCNPNPWPLRWEITRAAQQREPLAPPASHDASDHRPSPPPVRS